MTSAIQHTKRIYRMAVLGAVLLLALLGSYGTALAGTTITVNTTADELNADGDCSLREAIQAATTDSAVDACPAGSSDDTITLPAGTYTLAIAGTGEDSNATGDLDITSGLTINGAGATTTIIDGGAIDRVLHFVSSTVEIDGVTITNGNIVSFGGGIANGGTLTLTNSTISGNIASVGGGIWNSGPLTLTDSAVNNNTCLAGGCGIFGTASGTITLVNTTVDGNVSSNEGGGFWVKGTINITSSVVSNNTAPSWGGGIYNGGTMTLTNSTVSGNSSWNPQQGAGGGIFVSGASNATLTLNNSTVSNNSAAVDGGGIWNGGSTTLTNTIIANSPSGNDCSGTATSLGNNLDSDNSCNLTEPTDLPNTDPLLGPLQANGGPTFTHALLPGSPAIDAGNPATPGSGGNACESTDQRGAARPQGSACDIGAYEFLGAIPATPIPGVSGPGLLAMTGLLLATFLWTAQRRRRQVGA